ncbi:sigma-70 family RNA polymerase sigma factor [Pseudonocardia sp. DSM 110487]|uniref:sigma-70 family RNA polymerase sigma factor n=1 Tax=Pseudonocardia sp. DSM 110487 TaxID=2865833 RepID=UPI001C695239|nr:sigma-70 family RNA polymerase sigma factor [Pseudonocardia sp. DSM 110487]QYN34617.1 sigma-70 family RNA polymerase sigma factor [Pseudonocardia sp. DSM 110487]
MTESDSDVAEAELQRARAGDGEAFRRLVAPLHAELQAHCYRMLGSLHDAEDALQDALLRAWRGMDRFEGRSSVRSWLYKIATNACLDAIGRRGRRALPIDLGPSVDRAAVDEQPLTDVAWLGPYPDSAVADGRAAPHARYEQRESVELAFVAAMQHLPGNQRAALLLFEVLGYSAKEVADTLDTTPASVNSALQRARKVVHELRPVQSQQQTLRALGDTRLRELVTEYATALERGDADTLVSMLTADATWSMPPLPSWYRGAGPITDFLVELPLRHRWRHMPVRANGQQAVACYIWDEQAGAFVGRIIDVLTLRGDRIAAVTAFIDEGLFPHFGLPETLPAES